jgi:Flp pilus assembly protein TadG
MGLRRRARRRSSILKSEEGSISVLTLGLFMISLITLLIITNISTAFQAKRALTQATEAAAQRGVRNLDLESYYQDQYDLSRLAINIVGDADEDPGIPIDCKKGVVDAVSALRDWSSQKGSWNRDDLTEISIRAVDCDGYQLSLQTSAVVKLPFLIPFIGLEKITIISTVGTIDERKRTTNYYGLNIG